MFFVIFVLFVAAAVSSSQRSH